MQPRKYRVILTTTAGKFMPATSDTVNGLADMVYYWLNNTPAGRSVYNDQMRIVGLYEFDLATAQYILVGQYLTNSRKDLIAKVRLLGAR